MRNWHGNLSPFGKWHTGRRTDDLSRVIALLFSNNEPGFLTPISPSVCFTDTAGTTQAQVGQAVALVNDRSGRGNNWTQPTLANRPILGRKPKGGRRNLLRQTATLATQTRVVTAAQHTLSFRGTGTVTLSGTSTDGPLVGTGANDLVSLTFTPTAGNLTLTVSGTVNDAQLELGAVRTAYQLVADAGGFDVTEAGKADCHYLFCGGSADPRWMQTPTITPGTDAHQSFLGIRKLQAVGTISIPLDHGDQAFNQTGRITVIAPGLSSEQYTFRSITSTEQIVTTTNAGLAAPHSAVVTGFNAVGANITLRVNGAVVASQASVGTGNYAALPAHIGARNLSGTIGNFFNGEIYALGVRFGPNLDTATIEQVERYVASLVAEDTI
jgi:hypothetical protein